MRSLQGIVLAAGTGTRMKSETPKVLHALCGRPMIAYALDLAAAAGIKQPLVILGESAEQVAPKLTKEAKVVIQKNPLGTGDAVLATKRTLGGFSGDLLILYADTPLLRRTTIQRLIETHHKSDATCTLLTTHLADPTGYGRIVRDAAGTIVGVVEEAEANVAQRAIREINVGPMCVKAQPVLEALANIQPSHVKKEWYLTQALSILAQQPGTKFQTVRVEEAGEALGVNSQVELAKATAIIRQRILDSHLHNGITIVDPHATYIDHGVTIGHDTTIHPGTVIESGVTIGRRCSIGPFARLRSGVTVADDSRIGNFVELVRTKIGHKVRINHVTYLGDTIVEDDVNVGAGTMTANFDGTQKHPTTIGKGAFIGCDTVLIAPVHVGPGAVTGAGSVVPKGHDVPPRGLVMGVPARPVENVPATKAGGPTRPSGQPSTKDGRQDGQRVKETARVVVPLAKIASARQVKPSRPTRPKPPMKPSRPPAKRRSRSAPQVRRAVPRARIRQKARQTSRRRGRSGTR